VVVTGDVTQIDLPAGTKSGLKIVQEILDGIEDLEFCFVTSQTWSGTDRSAGSSMHTTGGTPATATPLARRAPRPAVRSPSRSLSRRRAVSLGMS
jgi:hypothetical protein